MDNSFAFGTSETTRRHGNSLSNAVLSGNTSLQGDAIMNNGGGTTYRVVIADDPDTSDNETVESTLEDRNVDAIELGVTVGFGENGKVAFIHKSYEIGVHEEPNTDN